MARTAPAPRLHPIGIASRRLRAAGRNLIARSASFVRRLRGRHLVVLDVVGVGLSIYIALSVRLDRLISPMEVAAYLPAAALPLLVRPIVNDRFGLYRRLWGHASVPDLVQILRASVACSAVCVAIFYAVMRPLGNLRHRIPALLLDPGTGPQPGLHRGVAVPHPRAHRRIRARSDRLRADLAEPGSALFGAGRAGATMARSAVREPGCGVIPVGFLDDDRSRHGSTVAGLPVFGDLSKLDAHGSGLRRPAGHGPGPRGGPPRCGPSRACTNS
jgi:FlaA1/EpsC-like NDP-sugar epimerase